MAAAYDSCFFMPFLLKTGYFPKLCNAFRIAVSMMWWYYPVCRSRNYYLAAGTEVYDTPMTVYPCETIEDACIASVHYLITNHYNIRKCNNCGRYSVACLRSSGTGRAVMQRNWHSFFTFRRMAANCTIPWGIILHPPGHYFTFSPCKAQE